MGVPPIEAALCGIRKRKLAHPVQPKEHLSADTVQEIADVYVTNISLSDVRFLSICWLDFTDFFVLTK